MTKDSKALLKEAKKLLTEKEYLIAIKICKKVLKDDKYNYTALVLMGASLLEVDDLQIQVPTTLKKAVDIQPDNPLAWHGLMTYYERQPPSTEIWSELVSVYKKLLQLESDLKKMSHYLKNISEIILKLTNDEVLSDTVNKLCKLKDQKGREPEAIKAINETIVSVLIHYPKLTNDYDEILEQVLITIIEDENSVNRHEYYKRYLRLLYKLEKYNKLLSEAIKMHEIFSQDIYPLEWICKVYSELSITDIAFDKIDIVIYYETLLDHESESVLGYFAQSVYLYKTDNLIDARNILSKLVSVKPKWFHAWYLLSIVDVKLYCWEDAECAAQHAQKIIPEGDPHKLLGRINLILLEALVKSPSKLKWKRAEALFDNLSDNSSKSAVLRAHLAVQLRDPQANHLINNLKNDSELEIQAIILHATDLLLNKHLEEAAYVVRPTSKHTSEAWLTLGKIHWEMADYGHSLLAFIRGLEADGNNWECLLYLGKYYQNQTQEYEKSKKSYLKALQINPNSDQAGIGLSLVYRLTKNIEANIKFLNDLTSQSRGPKWAFLQLGLQHLDNDNISEAISILRNATKIDPNDSNCWECLADAYLKRGAYLSAEKSYARAVELNPESFYSMTQIANIKLMIGQYASAKTDYISILEKSKDNVAVFKGLAECCFKLGKDHANQQLLARARDDFQEAVDFSTKALIQKSNFLSNWKLLGDICFTSSLLPEKYCFLKVISDLIQSDVKENYVILTKKDILLLSSRCFCKALSISKNSSLLWHDLARCYLAQAYLNISENYKDTLNKSLVAAKQAVKLNPSSPFHWNLLGVICMSNEIKNYALAQHSFAMAIEKESNNAVAWTNLGTLYYLLDDPYRANEAFSWAQKGDPAYVNCWIGQAFIAENFSQKDAMDLFRHAAQLSYHHEAATGYAHWVLKTVMDSEAKKDLLYDYIIEKMHAVIVASDSMSHYTAHVPTNSHALNSYGLLLERQKLYKSAAEMFSNALKYLEDDKHKDEISVNLARVMVQQEKYEDAVKICLGIKEANFASHCQLALSLFKAEHFKESYEAYEAALHWLADAPSDKAHVLCAMAAMAYMFQESNDAKTLLYQSIDIKPPIVSGLLALAALGMLDGDKNLTHLVLKELKLYDNLSEYRYHIAKLTAYSYLIQNDMEGASRVLCKNIHRYPDSSELWTNLAKILLTMSDINPFYKCVDKALFLGNDSSNKNIAKIKCMSSLSKLITLNPEEGLRSVLNTVHSFPANVDSWSILITSLMPRWSKISQLNAHWLMVLASRVRNTLICTRNMEQWLLKNEKLANDIAYC
ncbi:tetratricopeptide repeat protein 37 [Phymastichus coffea]|uniref:tetratricopeptide repeat protein 37 n=1 Tax=Phymastichus coffea TaxID=108790 RepID=UPI00273CA676|nr:tetratricopeptide repeat protein 37 [Phymastichus coffea]XP_058800398.1 tetratricopeptide repeat protein 37 [Phymastichus coffea]